MLRHTLGVVFVEPQCLGDRAIGQIQAHEIQAHHPDPQGLMVAGEDGPTQLIEPAPAVGAAVLLPFGLRRIPTLPADRRRGAVDAAHASRPTQGTDSLETVGIVNEVLDVEQDADGLAPSKGPELYPSCVCCAGSAGLQGSLLRPAAGTV